MIVAILFSLFFAALITALFYLLLENPLKKWGVFFVIIFLVYFSATRWMVHAGPPAYGHYWLPAFVVAVLVAVLMAALYPKQNKRVPREKVSQGLYKGDESEETIAMGAFFWIFLLMLLITAFISAAF